MACGVYVIENSENDKKYVGSSNNLARRKRTHWASLRANKHHAVKLQRAWEKHGPQAFTFKILLYCSPENLLMYEQMAIDGFRSAVDGYNMLPTAGSRLGAPHSEAVLVQMSRFQRGRAKKYEWAGGSFCLAEIAEMAGVPFKVLARRVLESGWDIVRAVTAPYRPNRSQSQIEADRVAQQKRMSLAELSSLLGMPKHTISQRLYGGWLLIDAVTTPLRANKRRA